MNQKKELDGNINFDMHIWIGTGPGNNPDMAPCGWPDDKHEMKFWLIYREIVSLLMKP